MAKSKIIFECNQCGYQSGKWNGRCPDCGSWNSFEEVEQITSSKTSTSKKTADLTDKILELSEIDVDADVRYKTGIGEFDRVLGGGHRKKYSFASDMSVSGRKLFNTLCFWRGIRKTDKSKG